MAVHFNVKGTTTPSFQVGKRGGKIFGATSVPADQAVTSGDLWLDSTNASVKIASVTNNVVSWVPILVSGTDITTEDLTVTGNLTVTGTQTTLSTNTLEVEDNIVVLNSEFNGADNVSDGGIVMNRGAEPDVSILWDESEGEWTLGAETLVAGGFVGTLSGNVIGSIRPNGTPNVIEGNTVTAGNLSITNAYAFPTADGTADQVLTTDGQGNLTFASINAQPGGSNKEIQFNNDGAFYGSPGLTFDKSNGTLTTGLVRSVSFEQFTDYSDIAGANDISSDLGSIINSAGAIVDQGFVVTDSGLPMMPTYSVSTLPTVNISAGTFVFCSDETGGPTIVVFDGNNWRRVSDNNVAS